VSREFCLTLTVCFEDPYALPDISCCSLLEPLIVAIGEATQFKNGRHLAAWLGLVPREHSTGGKPRLLGVSTRGNIYLRKWLVHGARATLRWIDTTDDERSRWLRALIARRGKNRASVIQAPLDIAGGSIYDNAHGRAG
jgi:Transposase IS116/IS110/IS902 family